MHKKGHTDLAGSEALQVREVWSRLIDLHSAAYNGEWISAFRLGKYAYYTKSFRTYRYMRLDRLPSSTGILPLSWLLPRSLDNSS